MCAVKRSQHAAVKFFMSRSCPMKCKDLNWRTVLHVAVACADIETVDLILAVSTAMDRIVFTLLNWDLLAVEALAGDVLIFFACEKLRFH